jgi:hypothetical protein
MKRKCCDEYVDWLLSQRGRVSSDIDLDDDRPAIGTEIHHIAQDAENLNACETRRDPLIREQESVRPLERYTNSSTMQLKINPRRLRKALEIPFWRMIKNTGRALDDSTQKEWLDDAEQRLCSVISRIDPVPVSYGYVVERDADGLTIHAVTGLKVAKHAIGQLSSGEWPR